MQGGCELFEIIRTIDEGKSIQSCVNRCYISLSVEPQTKIERKV